MAEETYPKIKDSESPSEGEKSNEIKRLELENKLEAIQFDYLTSLPTDLNAKFEEARHSKGFKAVSAGNIWDYQFWDGSNANTGLSPDQLDTIKSLEKAEEFKNFVAELNALNTLRQEYDNDISLIHGKLHQLFADWYKYMLSAHPPMAHQAAIHFPTKYWAL